MANSTEHTSWTQPQSHRKAARRRPVMTEEQKEAKKRLLVIKAALKAVWDCKTMCRFEKGILDKVSKAMNELVKLEIHLVPTVVRANEK